MNPLLLLVATTAIGIDIGYQPLETGGLEYIIQFEPQQLEKLNQGMDLVSEVPPELDVRRYRIQVGTDKLPHDLGTQPHRRDAAASKQGKAAKDALDNSSDQDAVDEPDATAFESPRRGPISKVKPDHAKSEEATADEADGPELVGEPAGPDKTFSSEAADQFQKVRDLADRARPRQFDPDEEAGPLPDKSIEAAAFADRGKRGEDADEKTGNSHSTKKPAIDESAKSRSKAAVDADETEPEKPWMTLVWTIAALCVSLGLNVYLGSIAWTARERYRLLLERSHGEPVEV